MTPLSAQPSPELGPDLVRDVVDIRRLPRWDPRYWGHVGLEDEPRCSARFRALCLSWAKARLTPEPLPDERDGERELTEDELRLEPKDAIACATQGAVPALVSADPASVIAAIDLDDEVGRGRTEINDESADDDLALEGDAELTAANGLPEALFGRRKSRAQGVSAGREQLRASDIERPLFQGSLLVPAKWPGVAPLGAGSVTRAGRVALAVPARGAERAPLSAARPLRRDEVRGEQPSIHAPSVSPLEQLQAHPLTTSPQARPPVVDATRRDEVRGEQPSIHAPSVSPLEQLQAHPLTTSPQARPPVVDATPQRDYLPHSRAAHAAGSVPDGIIGALRGGVREHEFGEGRTPAGGEADEDARVGATHDESDERVVKMSTDASDAVTSTLYPFETLEVRGTVRDSSTAPQGYTESTLNAANEVPYLVAHGVRLARLHYEQPEIGEPRVAGAALHVLFELGDHLGSTSVVLDKATSELVEASTYQGYGAKESDYRPERWRGFREDYGFTGKEEDAEFGIVYFGKRFYSPGLNRWVSADPLAVHVAGKGDLNLYAYVKGAVLIVVDPLGLVGNGEEGEGNVPKSSEPVPQEYAGANSGQGGDEKIAQVAMFGPLSLAGWVTAGLGVSCDSPPCVGPLADPAMVSIGAGLGSGVTSLTRGVTAELSTVASARVVSAPPPLTVQVEQAATAADGIVEKLASGDAATSGVLPASEVSVDLESLGNPNAPRQAPGGSLQGDIDAAFASDQLRSGTMVQFSDSRGALSGSGPKQGTGAIWYHDNIKIPGAGPGGATVELRTHAPNPGAPPGSYSQSNYTTQINSSKGAYLLPDGSWKTISSMTDAERAAAHYPAGN